MPTDSVTLKEVLLGTWIRGCNKGPSPLFKIQTHNRRLKTLDEWNDGDRLFRGQRVLGSRPFQCCRVPGLGANQRRFLGVPGPSLTLRRAVTAMEQMLRSSCALKSLPFSCSNVKLLLLKELGTNFATTVKDFEVTQ